MKPYLRLKYVVPILIILGTLLLFFLFRPNVFKKFKSMGQISFTRGAEAIDHQETDHRLRGRFKIPLDEIDEFNEINDLQKNPRTPRQDLIISEKCTADRSHMVLIRVSQETGLVDIDILDLSVYTAADCTKRRSE